MVVFGIDCLACKDEFMSKENYERAVDCAPHLSRSLLVSTFHVQLILSSPSACLLISSVSVAHFQDLHKI
jgi:hypothetical protein